MDLKTRSAIAIGRTAFEIERRRLRRRWMDGVTVDDWISWTWIAIDEIEKQEGERFDLIDPKPSFSRVYGKARNVMRRSDREIGRAERSRYRPNYLFGGGSFASRVDSALDERGLRRDAERSIGWIDGRDGSIDDALGFGLLFEFVEILCRRRLPSTAYLLLRLAALEGLTQGEAAEVAGVSVGEVRDTWQRKILPVVRDLIASREEFGALRRRLKIEEVEVSKPERPVMERRSPRTDKGGASMSREIMELTLRVTYETNSEDYDDADPRAIGRFDSMTFQERPRLLLEAVEEAVTRGNSAIVSVKPASAHLSTSERGVFGGGR